MSNLLSLHDNALSNHRETLSRRRKNQRDGVCETQGAWCLQSVQTGRTPLSTRNDVSKVSSTEPAFTVDAGDDGLLFALYDLGLGVSGDRIERHTWMDSRSH